jgi:hypothetical protein
MQEIEKVLTQEGMEIRRSADSVMIEQCWRMFRADQIVPLRTSVSAKRIPPGLLPRLGIFTLEASGDREVARYRLAGTKYRQIVGAEITGKTFDEYVAGGDVDDRAKLVHLVRSVPVGVWWVSEVAFGDDHKCFYCSTLLPLRSNSGNAIDHCMDFVEFEIPLAFSGQRGILSSKLVRYEWIDLGAGTPPKPSALAGM